MLNIIERFNKFTSEIKENIAFELGLDENFIILMENSICIGDYFELYEKPIEGLSLKVKTDVCHNKLSLLKKISDAWEIITTNFFHYIHIKNQIGDSYIDTPKSIVNAMIGYIEKRDSSLEYDFLLPFRERIKRTLDIVNADGIIEGKQEIEKSLTDTLIEEFDYVIHFSFHGNKNKFTYYIDKVSHNRSFKSVTIKTDEIYNHQAKSFIEQIMYYGELKL